MQDNDKKKGEEEEVVIEIDDLMQKIKDKILEVFTAKNNM